MKERKKQRGKGKGREQTSGATEEEGAEGGESSTTMGVLGLDLDPNTNPTVGFFLPSISITGLEVSF